MTLTIIRADITKMHVDAIVNAANATLLGGGGVDGAIHKAAGSGLLAECAKLGGCTVGEAKITGGYDLPSKYVIHTVGPIWQGGGHSEREMLEACYKNSLALAARFGCDSVAFPLISSGAYGYPKAQALSVATKAITECLFEYDIEVFLVIFDRNSYEISSNLYSDVKSYISDKYADKNQENIITRRARLEKDARRMAKSEAADISCDGLLQSGDALDELSTKPKDLSERLRTLDESFSEALLRLIDREGIGDVKCYQRANIDRRLFSKIRSDANYRPSKATAAAFAIALRLNLDETASLLQKAGFALSHSSKFDIIIEYFIENQCYDIYEINEVLFAFDQPLLGAK